MSNILVHTFRLPLFKGTVYVVVADNIRTAIDWAEDRTSEVLGRDSEEEKISTKAAIHAFMDEKGKSKYFILLNHSTTPGTIAHEVKHLINMAFSWYGYKLSLTNDEMECYYLEDIVNKVYNTVQRFKKKYKSKKLR